MQCNEPYKLLACHIEKTSPELLLSCTKGILHRWDDWITDGDRRSLCSRQISWNTKQCDSVAPLLALHTTWASHQGSWFLVTGFFIIRLIGALVRGISSSWRCFAAFAFSSRYWNTSFRAFIHEIWKPASGWFDCWYACLRSIVAFSGSSELIFKRLPSWRIWSEKWFRRCIFTKLKSDLSTRWCAISDSLCVLSSSTWRHFAAAERLFQVGSLSRSSCLSKVRCFVKASQTFFVDLLAQNRMKTSLWRWNFSG